MVVTTIDRAHTIGIFNKYVDSKKYQRLQKMGEAKRLKVWPDDIKDDVRNLSSRMNAPAITAYILAKYNVYIRPHSTSRHLRLQERRKSPYT